MIIGIDVDGVLRNFDKACIEVISKRTKIKEINVDEWTLHKRYKVANDMFDIYRCIFIEQPYDVFVNAEPYEGVKEVLPLLADWAERYGNRICAITTQVYMEAKKYTIEWLTNLQDEVCNVFDDIIFTDKKYLYVDILLDDNLKNLEEARKYDKIAVAMARPYNRLWTGVSVLNLKGFYNFLQQRSWEYE